MCGSWDYSERKSGIDGIDKTIGRPSSQTCLHTHIIPPSKRFSSSNLKFRSDQKSGQNDRKSSPTAGECLGAGRSRANPAGRIKGHFRAHHLIQVEGPGRLREGTPGCVCSQPHPPTDSRRNARQNLRDESKAISRRTFGHK